jgi:hypothetical protein
MVDEMVRRIAEKAKSKFEILSRLDAASIEFEDRTWESGYMNIRIPVADGYIRVYDHLGEIRVQKFEKVVFQYSGIPTFEPSGRRSF